MKPTFQEISKILKESVELEYEPVGLKFYQTIPTNGFKSAEDHRLCQLVMRARKGESLILAKDEVSCPAAAAALGFKPLPKNLEQCFKVTEFSEIKKQR
jgi:uncharacterized protein (DUF169 family)